MSDEGGQLAGKQVGRGDHWVLMALDDGCFHAEVCIKPGSLLTNDTESSKDALLWIVHHLSARVTSLESRCYRYEIINDA